MGNSAENLYDSAERVEEGHPEVVHLVTGHFREDVGYASWRSQGTRDWLLIYTVAGAGRFSHPGGTLTLPAGQAALYRPGTQHDYRTEPETGRWELLWAHFFPRPEWAEWLAWPEAAPGLMHLTLGEPVIRQKIADSLATANRLATGGLRRREAFAMNALEEALLWCDTQNPRSEQARVDPRIRECVDYLCRHLTEKVRLDDLADRAGLSPSRFAHLFRSQTGRTAQQFLEDQRLQRARRLLEVTARPIQEIAAEVGFENPFYFTLRFKRLTGLSPRDYRKRLGTAP